MNNSLIICIIFALVHSYICERLNLGYDIENNDIENNDEQCNTKCNADYSYLSTPGDFKISTEDREYLPFDNNCEKTLNEPFMFVQAADIQFGMQERWFHDRIGWAKEIKQAKQLVADVNGMNPRPKFIVMCGDLIHAWPSFPNLSEQQRVTFKKIFSGLEVPLVCVVGNHDIGNTPNNETILTWKKNFGDDYFSFWANGVFFIVINSSFFKDPTDAKELAAEQDKWLEIQLKVVRTEKPKHAVMFQHIPWFMVIHDEDNDYHNIDKVLRKRTLDRVYDAGIRYVFAGHWHRNSVGLYKDLEHVVTSAAGVQLGDVMSGYRVVKVMEDKIEHEYHTLGNPPQ
ncbi:unnamed protein product [Meganyctiphanes norvegica]|uniref:Calcineurin-like phosphoesterase domain-containing protein n=1 Tax=Meganyctiphanes norvegica TaxID=48144 RepID=A0AAV2S8R7_MEGNR